MADPAPITSAEELGLRIVEELYKPANFKRLVALWEPIGEIVAELGAEEYYTDASRQVFGQELTRTLASIPPKVWVRFVGPR